MERGGRLRVWFRLSLLSAGLAGAMLAVCLLVVNARGGMTAAGGMNAPILLPCAIEGTHLTAKALWLYEGPFLEDGSGREVVDVTALVLHNSSQRDIKQAQVQLQRGEEILYFDVGVIPAGTSVLVPEKNASPYQEQSITAISGQEELWQTPALPSGSVCVEESGIGTLRITNTTDRTLLDLTLYHKNYTEGLYVGGISYTTKIALLRPGETVLLEPEHYASGYSRIVRIE